MPDPSPANLPDFRDWSIVAVRLLQGVVYADEESLWSLVLASTAPLQGFFGRLGLHVIVDESEGLAYLRQLSDDELPEAYERLPKLIRRSRLSYEATLMCVLLRDQLRRHEEEDLHNDRCVIETSTLLEPWKSFVPAQYDEVRQLRELSGTLRKLEELGFVRRAGEQPESWEIRRILKARLPLDELERLHQQLLAEADRRRAPTVPEGEHGRVV